MKNLFIGGTPTSKGVDLYKVHASLLEFSKKPKFSTCVEFEIDSETLDVKPNSFTR